MRTASAGLYLVMGRIMISTVGGYAVQLASFLSLCGRHPDWL